MESPCCPALGICGYSGAGKTTLIERLLPVLARQGLRVAVIKHDVHGLQVDTPGKDSDRLFQAGADVLLHGPGEGFYRFHKTGGAVLEKALDLLTPHYDLILVEGHKDTPLPRIWLQKAGEDSPPPGIPPLAVLPRDGDRLGLAQALLADWLQKYWQTVPLHGCVLIGGASRRMGRPKHLIERAGRTWLERIIEVLHVACKEVVVSGAGALPPGLAGDCIRLPDCPDAVGPLAGVLSAMRWSPQAAWIICACDMPDFSEPALKWLLDRRTPGVWGIMPRLGPGQPPEPLGACYEPRARQILERQKTAGQWRLQDLALHHKIKTPIVSDGLACAWRNINTPGQAPL